MSENKSKKLWLLVLLLLIFANSIQAADYWIKRGAVAVNSTGTVELVLPAQMHRLLPDRFEGNGIDLDLNLVAPDKNPRAFELFWREGADAQEISLNSSQVKLLDDKRLMWEGQISGDLAVSQIRTTVAGLVGKVDFEVFADNQWKTIEKNVAIQPVQIGGEALIHLAPAAKFSRLRLYFSGYDSSFSSAPVFVKKVFVVAGVPGKDFERVSINADFETNLRDEKLELGVNLPGSGIWIESVDVTTGALFEGTWTVGREVIKLGERHFEGILNGNSKPDADNPQRFRIQLNRCWQDQLLPIRMSSNNYFGDIVAVKLNLRLPRLRFVADQAGTYELLTGANKKAEIAQRPKLLKDQYANVEVFSGFETNSQQGEAFVALNQQPGGGPFQENGFTWVAPVEIKNPGFYKLCMNEKAILSGDSEGFRIVKDGMQVPFFLDQKELKEIKIAFDREYDNQTNTSTLNAKIPDGENRPAFLFLKARGVFERKLTIEKHQAGMVGWQTWRTFSAKNSESGETKIYVSLAGFPGDQNDFRIVYNNGSNQPLEIEEIVGYYSTRNMFFVAQKSGSYSLYGGNPSSRKPKYDLGIIQQYFDELTPTKVYPGNIKAFQSAADVTGIKTEGAIRGAPFNEVGYKWKALFELEKGGLVRLKLNKDAALDNNPDGFRIVKDDFQVPFFAGSTEIRSLEIEAKPEYVKSENTTYVSLKLPRASNKWQRIDLITSGIFQRTVEIKLRQPGKLGWKSWKKEGFQSKTNGKAVFSINLYNLPEGETELQAVVPHGDNSPIEFSGAVAFYKAQDIFFQADTAGQYYLYGGNSGAAKPSYDIALIKNQLLKNEPVTVQLKEVEAHAGGSSVSNQVKEAFGEKGIGLYVVLLLVTLVLIVMIVKLFPEEEKSSGKKEEKK